MARVAATPEQVEERKRLVPGMLWTRYRVRWDFTTRLCGSVPADPEIVARWLDARKPTTRPPDTRSLDEVAKEVQDSIDRPAEEVDASLLTFQRHNGVLCQRASTIRSHLKECARTISAQVIGTVQGERAFSTRFVNGVYHDPAPEAYWIPILKRPRPELSDVAMVPFTAHTGERDKPIRVRTPMGERSALKRFEFVEGATMIFHLHVLNALGNKPSVSLDDLGIVMEYGGTHGYGGERGDGEGRYTYTIEPVA